MRVTMIGSVPPARGISPYVASLCTALHRQPGIELDVLSFRSMYPARLYPGDAADTHEPAFAPTGMRVRRTLTWWNPLGWLMAGWTLRGDVVHAQWWSFFLAPAYATVLAIARLRGKRVVVTVHNVEPHEGGIIRRAANRLVVPFAHHIIVHSEQNRRLLLARGITADRVGIVPIGIEPPVTVSLADPQAARRALRLPVDAPIVLFFGNIRAYKGVDDLIDAFALVAEELPTASLVIVGQPWRDAPDISARVAELGLDARVHLRLEFISASELNAYVAAADVVVFPYRSFDAQSAAACDALRFGRAIVVTDVGGLPDLVDDATAVVPARDSRSLARAIARVLSDADLRARLEAGARRRAAEASWAAVASMTAAAYEHTLGAPVMRVRESAKAP